MAPIRVLIVDDAVVTRQLLTRVLSEEPDFDVVGVARNGRVALEKLPRLEPDVVILDVEMPEMGGIETLERIRETHADLPVIMYSSLTERGAATTIEALTKGATDYLPKPSGSSPEEAARRIRDELGRKIKEICRYGSGRFQRARERPKKVDARKEEKPATRRRRPATRVDVVAVGVSTGGPKALETVLSELPADVPVPLLVVQHMPAVFTRMLAERLDRGSLLEIREAEAGAHPGAGQVWFAPGDSHLVVERGRAGPTLQTHRGPLENSCRPSVDVLFRSVVDVYGSHVLGVVLTGMGRDGQAGARAIRAANGRILVQDRKTSVVWGMPGAVVEAELADRVLPLPEMASEILRRVRRHR